MVRGKIELFDNTRVIGWLHVSSIPAKPTLWLTLDEKIISVAIADEFRQDLKDCGFDDGRCQFHFALAPSLTELEMQRVKLRFADSDIFLELPRQNTMRGQIRAPSPTSSPEVGLWIDRVDWMDELAGRHRQNQLTDDLTLQILQFVRDGYVILPRAVSADVIDDINKDIEAVWEGRRPGAKIETFEPDGKIKVIDADVQYKEGRTKLLDLYALSAAARRALTARQLLTFITAIFDDTPQAFQGLAFWKGSQQPIHKDTAYVRVDQNPQALVATWLALEDIQSGTGELEYYVGSHRAPDYKFGGVSKWMQTDKDDYSHEHEQFLNALHADAKKYNQLRSSFLARKGDVLVWHADLAHGGSIVKKDNSTRKSFVTHFCPKRYKPYFLLGREMQTVEQDGLIFISQHTARFADVI